MENGATSPFIVAKEGNGNVCTVLLENNVNVNGKGEKGNTHI